MRKSLFALASAFILTSIAFTGGESNASENNVVVPYGKHDVHKIAGKHDAHKMSTLGKHDAH